MTAYITRDGDLNAEIARKEIARQARQLVLEGLADESEESLLLVRLRQWGYGKVHSRLLVRQETLKAIQPLLDDFFAFEAAVRL